MLRKYCEILLKKKKKNMTSPIQDPSLQPFGGPTTSNDGVFPRVVVYWSYYFRNTNKPIFFLQVVGGPAFYNN